MSLKECNKVETNIHELTVELDGQTFEKAVNQAYLRENKKIALPGFRKGKAPRAMVERMYGADVFYEEAIRTVYPDAVEGAVAESGLDVVDVDSSTLELVSAGKDGLVFKVKATVKPEVSVSEYKGLAATKKSTAVSDEEVEQELKRAQQRNARMVAVEDRAAEKDDIAVIDFEGFVDGTAFEGGKGENYSLTLGSGQFIPGFEDQIVGHKAEDEFDVNVMFPEDYQAKELAGKEAVFKVKLHEIKKNELPELDDDFAKDVSEFDTLEAYKAHLKEDIEHRKSHMAEDDVKNQLIDKLIENLSAEIPQVMFDHRVDDCLRDFEYRLSGQGLNVQSYMQYTGLDLDGLRKQFVPQAERQVKLRLALEKIAELEEIKPTEEELNAEYEKMAKAYNLEVEKIKPMVPEKDLAADIAVEKAMKIVEDAANVTGESAEEVKAE
ncbi:MAG: trigger factor [Acutalibacteraceae bacterium]|jgi:trigger factor